MGKGRLAYPTMIRAILIANRGEIARRIIRTCRRMGIRAVAVYAEADAHSRHVEESDTAVPIGPSPAAASYLNIPAVVAAAQRAGVDAVHPGFGFLAENDDFARACAAAGLVFIGPTAEAIATMGDKRAARALAERAGLAVIPGFDGGEQTDEGFARAALRLGYPIMVKAAAGGGGKGMRLVAQPGDLPEALASARREAASAFGSGELLLERALLRPRHIEMQILGDRHGRVVHLGERECSIQRRHQKVIEETPSPVITPALRDRMGTAAVTLAGAVGYVGAGTVEFLLDGDSFYFLEMNTRLQVEHPVTELVTGLDLVEWQIRVAEGQALPWAQDDIKSVGHAIEARLYAEDPAHDFMPATGTILLWRPPTGEGIRADDGIRTSDVITSHYDPLLAKIIAHAPSRAEAIRRLHHALRDSTLLGLTTNLPWLTTLLDHPALAAGDLSTAFIDEYAPAARPNDEAVELALIAAALARQHADAAGGPGYWRNNPGHPAPYYFQVRGKETAVRLRPQPHAGGTYELWLSPERRVNVIINRFDAPDMALTVDGYRQTVAVAAAGDVWWVQTPAGAICVAARPLLPAPRRATEAAGSLRAPLPGRVLAVLVAVGQTVGEGQPLVKLEAMKMEHTIRAGAGGVVEAIYFAAGDQVAAGDLLVRVAGD
ncbi:MAG: ATP-grasp domain-containing protein [Candidatus Promineofilum sp.]|nr:ATP-grasp domain-containing protein [Promineifilum sp.]